MYIPPSVVVHGLRDAQAAMAPGRPVCLLSAPGAGLFAGCLWWQAVLAAAGFEGLALLDCADAPGRAWEAIKLGVNGVVLDCAPGRYAVVAEYAAAKGAVLLPAPPPALDLAERGALRRLNAWLGG